MAETLAANARKGDFDTALIANDAAVLHAFVLAAQTLPICDGTKDASAEQTVALRFERAVVYGLRLGDFTVGPTPDLLRRGKTDS
jgi:hypothetical protein